MNKPALQGDRRQVSVLFTDMVGYTAIVESLGEERSVAFTKMIYDTLSQVVNEKGGSVRSFAGDSVMAVFGIPESQEDTTLRACQTAMAIHAAFAAAADRIEAQFGVRPQMRVGISSGAAVMASVEGDGAQLTAVGNTVNLASRIQALAPAGGTLICDTTRRQVEYLTEVDFFDEHEIKGVARHQRLWTLLSVREGATRFDASLARGLSGFVGREDELAAMSAAYERAREGLSVVDLMAEPGLGKTRLMFEFMRRADTEDATFLTGHCSADGQQVPFFPFLEVARRSFRLNDGDEPERIAHKLTKGLRRADLYSDENLGLIMNLLGLDPPKGALDGLDGVLIGLRTRDLFPALLEVQCRNSMVILQIEDIHWIDSASESLLRKLIVDGAQPNLLVVESRRPEYRPDWLDSAAVTEIALQPLTAEDIARIARTRLEVDALPEALFRQITERAGGNPLFGEELLAFFLQEGSVRVDEGRADFVTTAGTSSLPASMQGLLTARMDRLSAPDRALLQAAAAIGRRFDPGLLSMVVGAGNETGAALQRLQTQDIVAREPHGSDYMFKHVLLRDTVYQSLLSDQKAALHRTIADALETRSAGRLTEAADTLAFHYGLTDRTDKAFKYSAMAGAKGLGIFSLGEANRYFARARALYEADPSCASDDAVAAMLANYALASNISLQVKTLLDLAEQVRPFFRAHGDSRHHIHFLHHTLCCMIWNGRYRDARSVERQLSAMAERLGDTDSIAYARVSELAVSCYCGHLTSDAFEDRRAEAETALAGLDDAYLRNFYLAHVGWNAVCRGRVAEAQEAAERMIVHGNALNDPRSLGYGTAMKALIALVSDDYQGAYDHAVEARRLSQVQFEITIADAARSAALVALEEPGAFEAVKAHCETCAERGWTLFLSTPDVMLGVAMAIDGRIGEGLAHIEANIAQREAEGYQLAADWYRSFICEIYLQILSGEGGASLGVLLRNIGPLSKAILFGGKRIEDMMATARANPMFAPDGHHAGRAEMILGLLYKIKKKNDLAREHLNEARRIVAPTGPSPMLERIETALAALPA